MAKKKVVKKVDKTQLLWDIIKKANWTKDHDYTRIHGFFKTYANYAELKKFFHRKQSELEQKFHEDWLGDPGISVSDDGWSDLTAEVVGRGEKFYSKITLKKLQKMADDHDYHESFAYSFLD